MGWFKKEPNEIEKSASIFYDQFPTWAVQHSARLVQDLKKSDNSWSSILENPKIETALIDYLTGAHLVYLKMLSPDGVLSLLGGESKIVTAASSWPVRTQNFMILALEYLNKIAIADKGKKNEFVDSLEKAEKNSKPLDPLSVHLAALAVHEIESQFKGVGSVFLVRELYGIMFRLGQDQFAWLSDSVFIKHS